jgi:hypothetical protein
MKEHLLHIAPANVAAKPPVKKRKMDSTWSYSIFVYLRNCSYLSTLPHAYLLLILCAQRLSAHSQTFILTLSARVRSIFNVSFLSISLDRVTPTKKRTSNKSFCIPIYHYSLPSKNSALLVELVLYVWENACCFLIADLNCM